MKYEKISRNEANNLGMLAENFIGIISDGCTGVWGEGKTDDETIIDARDHYPDIFNSAESFSGCWFVEVE